MIFRFQSGVFRRLVVFNGFYSYSTAAAAGVPAQPQKYPFLVDYLINSIGLSTEEALSATKKVLLYKTSRNHPDLVVKFFKELGLNKNQIRSMAFKNPKLLTYNVEKTIRPKVLELQELGLFGSDLIRVLINYKLIFVKGKFKTSIEYLRSFLDNDANVVKAIQRFSFALDASVTRLIESNVQLLQRQGFSKEFVARILVEYPRCFAQRPEKIEEVLYMVENEFGIPRQSKMFYYGVIATSSASKAKIHSKMNVLRSFGLSDLSIIGMIKQYPNILGTSEDKLKKIWNFFSTEVGCSPDFLSSHPVVFNLSFEKRLLPRYEVMKVLNEKLLNKKKFGFYSILCLKESDFINKILLPFEKQIPDVVDSYLKIAGRKKTQTL